MKRNGFVMRVVSVVMATAFLWTNCVFAGGLPTNLSGPSQSAQIGRMLTTVPDVMRLLQGANTLRDLGVETLPDVFRNMTALEQERLMVLPLQDSEGRQTRYLIGRNGLILRVTKKDGVVGDDLLVLLDGAVKENSVSRMGSQVFGEDNYEWFAVTTKKGEDLINAFLKEQNEKWSTSCADLRFNLEDIEKMNRAREIDTPGLTLIMGGPFSESFKNKISEEQDKLQKLSGLLVNFNKETVMRKIVELWRILKDMKIIGDDINEYYTGIERKRVGKFRLQFNPKKAMFRASSDIVVDVIPKPKDYPIHPGMPKAIK